MKEYIIQAKVTTQSDSIKDLERAVTWALNQSAMIRSVVDVSVRRDVEIELKAAEINAKGFKL